MKKLSKKIKRFRVRLRRERRRQRKLEYDYRFLHNAMVTYERKLKKRYKIEDVRAVYRKTTEIPRYFFFTWLCFFILLTVMIFYKGTTWNLMKYKVNEIDRKLSNLDINTKKEIELDNIKREIYSLRREVEVDLKGFNERLDKHEFPESKIQR